MLTFVGMCVSASVVIYYDLWVVVRQSRSDSHDFHESQLQRKGTETQKSSNRDVYVYMISRLS